MLLTKIHKLSDTSILLFLFAFACFEVHGQSYGNLQMGGGGFVSGIIMSKAEQDLKYLRTDVGGAYRWDKETRAWIPLTDWASVTETGYLGVESIALDPNDPDKLYMSVGISYFNSGKSAILCSSDKGKTFSITNITSLFKIHGNGDGRNTGEKLVVDPNLGSILFCGSRDNGLFKSTDSGAGWSRVSSLDITTTSSFNGISFVMFDPSTGINGSATQTMIAGVSRTGENIYRSDDGGVSFYPVPGAPATLMPNRASLAVNRNLYITYANIPGPWGPATGQLWKYNLETGIWTNITPSGYSFGFGGISVDPNNPERVVATSINVYQQQANTWGDQIFLSTNGGKSWINKVKTGFKFDPNGIEWAKNGQAIHWAGCIEFDPFNPKKAYVISGNGLFRTDNIDSTTNVWKFDVKGIEETVPLDMVSIPGGPVISVVGDYDGTRYTDPTKPGTHLLPTMGTTSGLAYAPMDIKTVVRTGSDLYFSTDTAKTWKKNALKGPQGYPSLSADGKVILHSPGGLSVTYRSTDKAGTWSAVTGLTYSDARTVADAVNPSVFYAYNTNTGRMNVSLDQGKTFFLSGSPGSWGSKHIRTVPGFEGHIWVALYGGGLTRSVDYGAKFFRIPNVTSCSAVGIGKAALQSIYPTIFIWGVVNGVEGIFFSTDQGTTWNRTNDNEHEWGGPGNGQFVTGDMNNTGIVYMSTAGRGVVYAKPDFMLSSSNLTIPVDSSTQIITTVLNSDTIRFTWSSGDTLVAKVDSSGLVTGIKVGQSTITAFIGGGKSVKIAVKVANPVTELSVSPVIDSLAIAETIQLTAAIIPANATNSSVTWSSVNPLVASISSTGLVKGLKTGSTIIAATSAENIKVSFPIVVGIPLSELSVSPVADTVRVSETKQFTAIFTPSNTTENRLKWSSSLPAVAKVDANGLVTGVSAGSADIIATSSDVILQASGKIIVEVNTMGIFADSQKVGDIQIFPNPLKGNRISIDLGNRNEKTTMRIIDVLGRTIQERSSINEQRFQLDLSLRPGIYMIRFDNKQEVVVKRLIIED
jgi:xyloglucan-specific exo-beta-1,4-glucanase